MSKQIRATNKVVEKKKIAKEEEAVEFQCTVDLTNCQDFIEPKKLVTFLRQTIKVNDKAGNTKGIEIKVVDKTVSIKTSTAEGRKSQLVHRLPSNYVLNPFSAIDQSYPYFQR